jgi:signal transduction histidine kinase
MDLSLAAGAGALLAAELLTSSATEGPLLANLVVLLPAAVALAWRRRHPYWPLVALAVCYPLSGWLLTDIQQLSTTLVPALLAAYAIGRYADDLRPGAAGLVWTVVLSNLLAGDPTADDWIFPFLAFGAAAATGRALRTRALVAAELAERTERLAIEHELRAAEAAVEERRRIARELHDVVAHTLSVMVVQAGGARRQLGRDPERSIEALATVEATGRSALAELRRMLGFVAEAAGPPGAPAPLEPAPTMADIRGLARRAAAAGLPTTLEVEGGPSALPAGAEVAVFRIVQEALTNALKHAGPGARASVTLTWSSERLHVEICDDGPGMPAGHALPSGGHGLIGMRERVALYGGELEAGPRPAGGFRVAAWLPRTSAGAAVSA